LSGPTRRRRSRSSGELRKHVLGIMLAVFALGVLGAGAYVYTGTARPPTLDPSSLCPVEGPRSVTVVLLDSTDDIPDIAKREVRTALVDLAETLPAYDYWKSGCWTPVRLVADLFSRSAIQAMVRT
jgi:hypothetical protein